MDDIEVETYEELVELQNIRKYHDMDLENQNLRNEKENYEKRIKHLEQEIENMKNGFLATELYAELLEKAQENVIQHKMELTDGIEIGSLFGFDCNHNAYFLALKVNGRRHIIKMNNWENLKSHIWFFMQEHIGKGEATIHTKHTTLFYLQKFFNS